MDFLDIASIVFVCTAVNHLGLIQAIEALARHRLPVLNCIKCLTFWSISAYGFSVGFGSAEAAIKTLARAVLAAWSAIWLDLFMGIIDMLYVKVYDTLYPTTNKTNTDTLSANDTMP